MIVRMARRPYRKWRNGYQHRKNIAMADKLWPAKPYHYWQWNRGMYS